MSELREIIEAAASDVDTYKNHNPEEAREWINNEMPHDIKLTAEQQVMADECLKTGAAWITAAESVNHGLLRGWADLGWAVEVEPPNGFPGLAAYLITDAGRAALQSGGSNA